MLIGAPGLDCVFPGSTDAYPEGQDLSGSNGVFYRGACGTVIATQIAISPPTSCSDREMNGDEKLVSQARLKAKGNRLFAKGELRAAVAG